MEVVALLEFNQLNRSTNQVSSYSFLDCFRNVPSVSADGGRSTAGVQPAESINQPSKPAILFSIVFVTCLLSRQMEVVALLEFNQLNRSTNQVSSYSFLDCFRNVPSVSADGGRSTAGVQPAESINQPSKQLFFS